MKSGGMLPNLLLKKLIAKFVIGTIASKESENANMILKIIRENSVNLVFGNIYVPIKYEVNKYHNPREINVMLISIFFAVAV